MTTRRKALEQSLALAGLLLSTGLFPKTAMAAFNQKAFEAKGVADSYKALGLGTPVENSAVALQAPDIAENGAVVPIGATCSLPGVKQILFLVDKNPTALIAVFNLNDSVDAALTTRCKMGQTSDVFAVAVMNDNKVYFAKKEVKVTAGGCGG